MSQLTNWELFHAYRRLVREDKARALECPNCPGVLTTRLGSDDEPVLWCGSCLTTVKPGTEVISQIRAVVTEHFI